MNAHKKLATGPAFSGIPCLRRHKIIWQMTICSTIIDYHFYKKAPFPFFLFFCQIDPPLSRKTFIHEIAMKYVKNIFQTVAGKCMKKIFSSVLFSKEHKFDCREVYCFWKQMSKFEYKCVFHEKVFLAHFNMRVPTTATVLRYSKGNYHDSLHEKNLWKPKHIQKPNFADNGQNGKKKRCPHRQQ